MTGGQEPSGAAARASRYLLRWRGALLEAARLGPVLDIACGDGRNGLNLALSGAAVLLVDRSDDASASIREAGSPPNVRFIRMDLETPEPPSFGREGFGAVLVFRYLHRPLIPALKACLKPGGMLLHETYMEGQQAYGRPRNPEHLLRPGELAGWFAGYETLDLFEGFLDDPPRFMGRIACRKPGAVASAPRP